MTHYLELGQTLYALCGAAITKAEHNLDPSCPACRAAIDTINAQTADERFGTAADDTHFDQGEQ